MSNIRVIFPATYASNSFLINEGIAHANLKEERVRTKFRGHKELIEVFILGIFFKSVITHRPPKQPLSL
jgi:hypothetical protein